MQTSRLSTPSAPGHRVPHPPHHCRAPAVPSARAQGPGPLPNMATGTRARRAGAATGRTAQGPCSTVRRRHFPAPGSGGAFLRSQPGRHRGRSAGPPLYGPASPSAHLERGPSLPAGLGAPARAVRARGPPCVCRSVLACACLSGRRRPAARSPTRLKPQGAGGEGDGPDRGREGGGGRERGWGARERAGRAGGGPWPRDQTSSRARGRARTSSVGCRLPSRDMRLFVSWRCNSPSGCCPHLGVTAQPYGNPLS